MKTNVKSLTLIAAGLLAVFASVNASAQGAPGNTDFDKSHPRRAEVNHRLHHENRKISHDVRTGKLTPAQAHKLRHEERRIHREAHAMAVRNGGHLTPAEQARINHQERAVNHQRVQDIRSNGL